MRFGMMAAAAAALLCAGQADAARYVEFQVSGITNVLFPGVNGGPGTKQNVATTVTAAFDTIDPTAPLIAQGAGFATVFAPFFSRLYTLNQPAQTYFDLTFDKSAIPTSASLANIAASGTFGYYACDRGTCYQNVGTLISFSARTTDVAPAFLGSTQTFNAIPAVPEPATWLLMLAGTALVGYGLRRQKHYAASLA